MAVSGHWYDKAPKDVFTGSTSVNWASDTIKVALLTNSYTPDRANDHVWSDISTNEVSGTGYTAGGATLTTPTTAEVSHVLSLKGDDSVWTVSTITARYAAIYDTSLSNRLLGYVDFGIDVTSTAGTFTVAWPSGVLLTITKS